MKTLKALREAQGLTVKEAAEELDVSLTMIYMMESGTKKPGAELGLKIAKLYKCTMEQIFSLYVTG